MTHKPRQSRLAMTAIAAILAFSSTPLIAQDATPPDADAETSVVPAADPLAPAAVEAPVATEVAVPPAPTPKVETRAAPARQARAAARPSSPRPAARPVSAAKPAPITAAMPPAIQEAPAPLPVLDEPAPVAASEPAPPVATEPSIASQLTSTDEVLPIAGGAALGLLLIGGAAAGLRRRKRRQQEEEDEAARWAMIEATAEPEPQSQAEPAFARQPAPVHDPIPQARAAMTGAATTGAATRLPNGFDISRFGRHVQAAYRGPTPDNPSQSLKNRLRRASFFDQRERDAKEAAGRAAKVPTKGNWEGRSDADFLFRRAVAKPATKPAFSD